MDTQCRQTEIVYNYKANINISQIVFSALFSFFIPPHGHKSIHSVIYIFFRLISTSLMLQLHQIDISPGTEFIFYNDYNSRYAFNSSGIVNPFLHIISTLYYITYSSSYRISQSSIL